MLIPPFFCYTQLVIYSALIFRTLTIAVLALGLFDPAIADLDYDAEVSESADLVSVAVVDSIDSCCHKSHPNACHISHSNRHLGLPAPKQTGSDLPSPVFHSYRDFSLRFLSSRPSETILSESHQPSPGPGIYLTTLRLRL